LNASTPPGEAHNQPELTVSELSQSLKRTVESNFDRVRVRGEISGFKRAASGHMYMALKDDNAVLDAVCWRGVAGKLAVVPEDGLEVIVTGKLTTYPSRSRYQIVVDGMEMAGEGALLKLLEDRKRKLAAEGLFAAERKKQLPWLPEVIGVVTSPTGAVIRDILHRLADRFPRRVLVWPVIVQGEGSAEKIAAAIAGFNHIQPGGDVPRPDLLIVARGGGSVEDLWSFNEEVVVRAAADSDIPLISAVGHETDITLIDYAADKRAPTPTAAAEIAVPVRADLQVSILDLARRLFAALNRSTEERRVRLDGLARGLRDPREMLQAHQQKLDDVGERLNRALSVGVDRRKSNLGLVSAGLKRNVIDRRLEQGREQVQRAGNSLLRDINRLIDDKHSRLGSLAKLLQSYSYEGVLARGFAAVRSEGKVVTQAAALASGQALDIQFHDGHVDAMTTDGTAKPAHPARAPARKAKAKAKAKPAPDDDPQGSLL
jgi:exodeoxyribonuclease VII large subunit